MNTSRASRPIPLALTMLVAFFAAWMLIGGGTSVYAAIKYRHAERNWWLLLLLGIVSLAAGVIAVFNPGVTILVLVVLLGANALVTGVLEIVMAIRLRKTIEHEWLLGVAGLISVIFGVLVLMVPAAGAIAMVWLVSFYATLTGVLLLALAFRARKWAEDTGYKAKDVGGRHPGQPAT